MNKKFIVRLSEEERGVCREIIKNLKGSSQKVRRAQILLKADVRDHTHVKFSVGMPGIAATVYSFQGFVKPVDDIGFR